MADRSSIEIVNKVEEGKVAQLRYNAVTQELEVFIEQALPVKTIILNGKNPTFATRIIFASGASLNFVDTAITENSTLTSLAAGSVAVTTHNTGRGHIFYSDGTKWQLMIATTGG